ncbi:MAG: ATP-grasp domain-containing protein [Deltaproteobacteria bacterium]|nr:ATP-grasp domain-containing protein [Deltaproteobacteria bacterium]
MTEDKSSMLFWFPRIKDLPIPQPKTMIVDVREYGREWPHNWIYGMTHPPGCLVVKLRDACIRMGFPLFLRTDHLSAKHEWSDTCFVESDERLGRCVFNLVEASMMADLPINAFAVREYIPMATLFTAFRGNMPVNPEIRFFVRDGKAECQHWYWAEDAIHAPSAPDWRERMALQQIACKRPDTTWQLRNYAEWVAAKFEGYWSVDFCRAADGHWILIDLAEGKKSWHPADCEFNHEH